jgi:DNA polymerase IV
MRRPTQIECLYLDFDGFFASVEQQARSALRGKPVGVVPFAGAEHTCVIACSREAKLRGVKNVMPIAEARERCPDIVLVPQSPDLYRRAHNALLSEISAVIPVDAVKSIDELTCRVAPDDRDEPLALARRIKARIAENIGPYLTCSAGFAANRQLAKMACKAGNRPDERSYGDGCAIWFPRDMPTPLLRLKLADIPGVGSRMESKLFRAKILTMGDLLATQPKQMRRLWGNVTGERLWYALQGYDIQAPPSGRGMYGHGRVLPPDYRTLEHARAASRLLLTKPDGTGFADLDINSHRETWPIRAKGFRRWLARGFFEATQGAPSSELQSALNVIEAKAHFDAPERIVYIRVGGLDGKLYLDLGDENWRAVEIDTTGWG